MRVGPILLLAVTVLMGCSDRDPSNPDGSDLPRGRVTIEGQTVEVEVARTGKARARGLSGRSSLPAGTGILFLHDAPGRHAYWMKEMRFPIDILWLRAGRIVHVEHRVPPPAPALEDEAALPHYSPGSEADAILEVPAGYARAHGFDVGKAVTIELEEAGR